MPTATLLDSLKHERDQIASDMEALLESEEFNPEDKHYLERKTQATNLDKRINEIVQHQQRRVSASEIDRIGISVADAEKQKREADKFTGTMGEVFTRSAEYQEYRERLRGSSHRVEMPLQTRAPWLTSTAPGSAFIPPPQKIYSATPGELTPLLSAVGSITVSTNATEIVTYGRITGAAVVAEGAAKPEGTASATVTPVTLETIAVWIQVTRQLVEDATGLQGWIDTELRRSILRKVELQIGAAINAGTFTTVGLATDDLLEQIRVGVAVVEQQGFTANTVLLNPADFAAVDIAVWGNSGAFFGAPRVGSSFWGLQAISSSQVPAGIAYLGDFPTAIKFLNRGSVSSYISDSHDDTFTKNILTLLSEVRGVTAIVQPAAVVKVAGVAREASIQGFEDKIANGIANGIAAANGNHNRAGK